MPSPCNPVKVAEASADKHCDKLNDDGKSRKKTLVVICLYNNQIPSVQLGKCRNFGILFTAFLRIFCNFAVPFTKNGK